MARLTCLFALLAVCPVAALFRGAKEAPQDNFMNAKVGSVPALQPSEVFDEDFPVDMVKLTPHELRYRAQADYAKALAMLKRERAEAEAAQKAMEQALKTYQQALAAAKNAKLAAEEAAKNKAKYADASVDASTKAKVAKAGADNHAVVVEQEQKDLVAAQAAYDDAMKGTEGAEAKIAGLQKRRAELDAEIQKLEAESGAMGHTMHDSRNDAAASKADAAAAKNQMTAKEAAAAQEAARKKAEAEASQARADAAAQRLAEAKKMAGHNDKDAAAMKAAIAQKQKDFDDAEAKYMREKADADAAAKLAARAKAELAKYEEKPYSSARGTFAAASAMVGVAMACFF